MSSMNAYAVKQSDGSKVDCVERLRVLLYQFFPGGGIGRYTHELAKALSTFPEIDLTVVCSGDYEWLAEAEYDVRPILPCLSHTNSLIRRCKFLSAQLGAPRRLLSLVKEESADVVHLSNINYIAFPIWNLWIPSGVAITATAHDVKRAKHIVSRSYDDFCLKSFYRRSDALFVHSESQAMELVDWVGYDRDKVEIVPHGIYEYPSSDHDQHTCRRHLKIPCDVPLGLCFGQVRDDKNIDALMRALTNKEVQSHLVIAGSGGSKGHRPVEYYRKLATELGIEHRVHFLTGYVEESQVGRLFAASDWVSLTYKSSFTSQSGVLNVAMHYKRPVVVTPTPTVRQTVEAFRIGVSADGDTAEEIAPALIKMEQCVRQGAQFEFAKYAEAHSWENNASATIRRWQQLKSVTSASSH